MTTKKVTKLLAVVALASGPASGCERADEVAATKARASTAREAHPTPRDPWAASAKAGAGALDAGRVQRTLAALDRARAAEARDAADAAGAARSTGAAAPARPAIAVVGARPRELPSGAPACGNVASRAPRRTECPAPAAAASPMVAAPGAEGEAR